MELKSIFQMTKIDRYTQDGRDQLAKLQETEDVTYKTGDISQKTGLQKQPDGSWAPPKKSRLGIGTGKKETGNKEQKRQKHIAANAQHQFEAASETANSEIDQANLKSIKSFMDEEHATFKNALYSKAETLARRGARGNPDPENEKSLLKFAEAAGMADDLKLYLKEEVNSKYEFGGGESKPAEKHPPMVMPKGMHPAEFMKAWEDDAKKNGYKKGQGNEWREHLRNEESKPATSKPDTKEQTKALMEKYKDLPGAQKKDALYAATFEGSPIGMTQTSMERQGWDLVQADDDVNVYAKPDGSKVTMKHDGNKITSTEYEAPGSKPAESKTVEETKTETTAKFETEQENARYEEGKKGWETVSKERLPDIKKKVEQKIDYYKKYDPYAMLGKRTGLNAAQKKAVELNMTQAKENLAFFTGQLEGINEQMGATDSAPRILTGDCKIRVRK